MDPLKPEEAGDFVLVCLSVVYINLKILFPLYF